jgi:hypothetical protein
VLCRHDGHVRLVLKHPTLPPTYEMLAQPSPPLPSAGGDIGFLRARTTDSATRNAEVGLTLSSSAWSAGLWLAIGLAVPPRLHGLRWGPHPLCRAVAMQIMVGFYKRFLCIRDLPVPTIAAINGSAIGAGAAVTLACDIRLAAEDAKIGWTFSALGLHPGTCWRLVPPPPPLNVPLTTHTPVSAVGSPLHPAVPDGPAVSRTMSSSFFHRQAWAQRTSCRS